MLTPLDLLVYLRLTYGRIAPTQLSDCYNKMTKPYDMQDPIESLFSRIDAGVRYANAGGQPYDEAQYVNIEFLLVLATGVTPLACAEWQRLMPVEQSWTQFKVFFSNAHCEYRLVSETALHPGYHTANMVVKTPVGPPPRFGSIADFYHMVSLANDGPGSNIATAMANLATTTGSGRATVAALTKALAELTAFTQSQAAEL
jgi:hypothetical protein